MDQTEKKGEKKNEEKSEEEKKEEEEKEGRKREGETEVKKKDEVSEFCKACIRNKTFPDNFVAVKFSLNYGVHLSSNML